MARTFPLPDELLLNVGDHFAGKGRNRDLANLSLVCHQVRHIAQEKLLCAPTFHLKQIHAYMWELGHHPTFMPKIKRLEIISTSQDRVKQPTEETNDLMTQYIPGYSRILQSAIRLDDNDVVYTAIPCPPELYARDEFREKCKEVTRYYAKNVQSKSNRKRKWTKWAQDEWLDALDTDIVQALLGVLLVILPNLTELYLGASWLMDFPIFSSLKSAGMRYCLPHSWKHPWMGCVLNILKSKLQVLEFPADMEKFLFPLSTMAVFDFRTFGQLKYLSLSMETLFWCQRPMSPPADPVQVFPPTLELLRISECTAMTANLMNELCLAKKKGFFPQLRRVELYFEDNLPTVAFMSERWHNPDPVHDVRRMFADAGLELYLYFPAFELKTTEIGGTPWSFQEDGGAALKRVEEWTYADHFEDHMGMLEPFELHSDLEGDIEMRG